MSVVIRLMVGAACIAASGTASAQTESLYRRILMGTVWIKTRMPIGEATGTGWVVDANRKLIVTNHHVVGDAKTVQVVFPMFDSGSVIAEKGRYQGIKGRVGRVLRTNPKVDLAIVEVDDLPDGTRALPLAAASVEPGETINSVGNPGVSTALWVYTSGTVRQVYRKELSFGNGQTVAAKVVETQAPINPGDSGGPVTNGKGEIVGVVSAMNEKARLVSFCIDVSEVKKFLGGNAPVRRVEPFFDDRAGFFSEAAKTAFVDANRKWLAERQFEVVVATFPAVQGNDLDAVKAMGSEEKNKYYMTWGKKLATDKGTRGIFMLATKSPGRVQFLYSSEAKRLISDSDRTALQGRVLKLFGAGTPDAALEDLRKTVDEAIARETK